MLVEVHRILAPKGSLYIIDYNLPKKGPRQLAAIAFSKLDESQEAYKMLKSGNVITEVREAGFKIIDRSLACQGIIQLVAATKN